MVPPINQEIDDVKSYFTGFTFSMSEDVNKIYWSIFEVSMKTIYVRNLFNNVF